MTTTKSDENGEISSQSQGQSLPWEDLVGLPSQPDPLADLIIDVEGHQLYTSKYMLANVSSKFRQMFTAAAAENPNILTLPGTSLRAAVDLLRWLLPSETLTISGENVEVILKLAHEYNIKKLLEECDRFFYGKLSSSSRDEDFMKYLMLAQCYHLSDVKGVAIDHLSRQTKDELKRLGDSKDVDIGTMAEIFEKRLELFESGSLASRNVTLPENVILLVEDKEIVVSSAALATASDVFKTMIESDFLERKTGVIEMPGKSYEAVNFMVHFISSHDFVPITGDQLVGCVGLADEYILGKLKHACIEYMISNVEDSELNECMLYLSLASKYQLLGVTEKVIEVYHQRSITDVMQCENFDIVSAAPLMLIHARWLEEEVQRNTVRVENILSRAVDLYNQVDTAVKNRFKALSDALYTNKKGGYRCQNKQCDGFTVCDGLRHFVFSDSCYQCTQTSRKQFKETFTSIKNALPNVTPEKAELSWPSFSNKIKGQFTKLKSL